MSKLALIPFLTAIIIAQSYADLKSGKATTLLLNDGTEIPVLGLGTWLNGSSLSRSENAVLAAIDSGYRHIDTAAIYGTEPLVGNAIEKKIKDGVIKREDVYITTKLWNDKHAEDKVVPALRESLKNLKMDYVNLFLIHWPVGLDENNVIDDRYDFVDTWRGMEEALKLGLTRSIGVSNFNETQLKRLLKSAKVKPVVNQVEVNPNFTQKKLIALCNENDIKVVAYTPLGSMPEIRTANAGPQAPRLNDPTLLAIGDKYKKNTVQVVLRYLIDRGLIPIPKSSTPSRIQENIDVFDFKLTPEEIQKIDDFNLDYRLVSPKKWQESKYYPFN